MKKDIIESMKDIYAMKLVNWELEGKHDWVEHCLDFAHCKCGEHYGSCKYVKLENGKHWIITPVLSEDEINWCIGYAHTRGARNIIVKTEEFTYNGIYIPEYEHIIKRTKFVFDY